MQTDAAYLQTLMDFIDDKEAFWGALHREDPKQVFSSVKAVRALATATKSSCDTEEGAEAASEIATACRAYMREADLTDRTVQAAKLDALRKEVGRNLCLAIHDFGLVPPDNFDLSGFEGAVDHVVRNRP